MERGVGRQPHKTPHFNSRHQYTHPRNDPPKESLLEQQCCETVILPLVHSTAEYCAPVWCRSAHTCLIDTTINDALRIVTGCLRPTPVDNLPIHAGIQPLSFVAEEPHYL